MEENKVVTSEQFNWNLRDVGRGLLMAVLTPAVYLIEQSLDKGEFHFDWKALLMAAIGGGVGYLIKNFFQKPTVTTTITNSEAKVIKAEAVIKEETKS